MRIAWLAPAADPADDTAALVAELRARHEVTRFDALTAHDFVWQHARQPFDVCVYDLGDSRASAFVWPYLLHYPGIVRLRASSLRASRGGAMLEARRQGEYEAELRFSRARMLRVPLLAARLVVVADAAFAQALQQEYPEARVRSAPPAVPAPGPLDPLPAAPVIVGTCDGIATTSCAQRAARRAHDAGARFELRDYGSVIDAVREAHVLLAMEWPPATEPTEAALVGMAAGRAVVVYEVERTAGWPALDPQTWEPRGLVTGGPAIVISIDPRDADHSLMLAMRRLAADASLRADLGRAARSWWQAHAAPAPAAAAWEALLAEGAALAPPPRPADWPAHLLADGTARAREILDPFGVSVDVLR